MKFIKSNWVYLLWFIVYFTIAWLMLGGTFESFVIVAIFYAISISLALSPVGEFLLRLFEGARKLETNEEKEYLQPLFEEVYQNALEKNPKLNKKIKLYIIDAMFVNAFAMGRKTIAVTRGAVETFTQEELKGILAHEFGHMSYGHTKALLLSVIGNLMFSIFVIIAKIALLVIEFITLAFSETPAGTLIARFTVFIMRFSFDISIIMFLYIGQIILSINSRNNEYQADEFAYKIGYGEQLISGLYLLKKISITQKPTLMEKMTSSHPHIAKRIARLENMNEDFKFDI